MGVDKSYVKAFMVEDFGQLEHRVYVTLKWIWNANNMTSNVLPNGTHLSLSLISLSPRSHKQGSKI
jgi:hypothetical protein